MARILEWVAISSSRGCPDPGIQSAYAVALVLAGGFFTNSLPLSNLGSPSCLADREISLPSSMGMFNFSAQQMKNRSVGVNQPSSGPPDMLSPKLQNLEDEGWSQEDLSVFELHVQHSVAARSPVKAATQLQVKVH